MVDELRLDLDQYRESRTLQPITGFRVGAIDPDDQGVDVSYDRPVSYGIRRCEFDAYLLRRSGARLLLGAPASDIRRDGSGWRVNRTLTARMLVGAGGHFCPVARMLNRGSERVPVVAAQEVEFPVPADSMCSVAAERPELYFCPDLSGYGWCFRKGGYLNVGLGRLGARALPGSTAGFVDFLERRGRIFADPSSWRWRGHAYLLSGSGRRAADDGVVLIGDAAGLAYPQSGEGIRPAIESGLMAASAIVEAKGSYNCDRLEPYAKSLRERFGAPSSRHLISHLLPLGLAATLARHLLDTRWFVRHVVLDRWFLHAGDRALLV